MCRRKQKWLIQSTSNFRTIYIDIYVYIIMPAFVVRIAPITRSGGQFRILLSRTRQHILLDQSPRNNPLEAIEDEYLGWLQLAMRYKNRGTRLLYKTIVVRLSHCANLAITPVPFFSSIITIYRLWMTRPKNPMRYRCTVLYKCASSLIVTLGLNSVRQVLHARQCVGMVRSQHLLPRLHRVRLQLLSLLPSSPLPVCRGEIAAFEDASYTEHYIASPQSSI